MCLLGNRVWTVEMKTSTNLALYQSGGIFNSILEIGVSLDPLLGIPRIPAPTIKGAWRAAVYFIAAHILGGDKKVAEQIVKDIFDETPVVVRVFDAYPTKVEETEYLLIPDVLTPHYKSDTKNELGVKPNPLVHLTVPKGVVFSTVIGIDVESLRKTLGVRRGMGDDERRMKRWDGLREGLEKHFSEEGDVPGNLDDLALLLLRAGLIWTRRRGPTRMTPLLSPTSS